MRGDIIQRILARYARHVRPLRRGCPVGNIFKHVPGLASAVVYPGKRRACGFARSIVIFAVGNHVHSVIFRLIGKIAVRYHRGLIPSAHYAFNRHHQKFVFFFNIVKIRKIVAVDRSHRGLPPILSVRSKRANGRISHHHSSLFIYADHRSLPPPPKIRFGMQLSVVPLLGIIV